MKYVLMYSSRPDLDAAVPEERRMEVYGQIFQWFETHASVFVDAGAELQGPETATTVRLDGGRMMTTDGPFIEGKEVVSGFTEIEVEDLDEALRMVKTWPACPVIEIRPVADM